MTSLNTKRILPWRIVLAALLLSGIAIPASRAFSTDERHLSFYHTHTRDTLKITYSAGGEYLQPSLQQINEFLLDFRTGDKIAIDPELLDLLYDLRQSLGSDATYEIISAYRSPATNEMLRDKSSGVAKNSCDPSGVSLPIADHRPASGPGGDAGSPSL